MNILDLIRSLNKSPSPDSKSPSPDIKSPIQINKCFDDQVPDKKLKLWKCSGCGLLNYPNKLQCIACFKLSEYASKIYRRHHDFSTGCYGDGGEAYLKWNIYISDKLDIDENIKNNLKNELIEIGKLNNDYRENEPILNIIDPDLYVFKHYDNTQYDETQSHINAVDKKSKGFFIRSTYSWLATECIETEDNKIKLISPIHNLQPVEKYQSLYSNIEHIFTKMMPLFNKFDDFKNRKHSMFQCIIKSQRYEIDDMSGYNGHWHQEGLNENIKYVGIYYFEKDKHLKGGNLRFINLASPADGYYDKQNGFRYGGKREYEVTCYDGTAVVFDNNTLVHRVRMLKNKMNDGIKRYRSFILFFIIDPNHPIISTESYPNLTRRYYVDGIYNIIRILSLETCALICEFANAGYSLKDAKEVRKMDISIRKEIGKFGYMDYGNSGDKVWFNKDNMDKWHDTYSGERKQIHQTESSLNDTDHAVYNYHTICNNNNTESD